MPLLRQTIPMPMPLPRPVLLRTIPLPLPYLQDGSRQLVHDHIPFEPNLLDPANISSGEFILPPWTVDIPKLMPLLLSMPSWIREDESKLLHDGPYVHMTWKPVNNIYLPYCYLCGRWASIDHFACKKHSDRKAPYYAKHDVRYRREEQSLRGTESTENAVVRGLIPPPRQSLYGDYRLPNATHAMAPLLISVEPRLVYPTDEIGSEDAVWL